MRLFEFEAKELFEEAGIATPDGLVIKHAEEMLNIPAKLYPRTIKTQVLSGGRGKAGGIQFANDPEHGYEQATKVFNLPIKGELPTRLLIEPKVEIKKELYVSILIDRAYKGPILMGSADGGVEIEAADSIQIVPVPGCNYSPFLARKLGSKMGLQGKDLIKFSNIVNKLWEVWSNNDCDLAEINPLIIDGNDNFIALDGKITINEDAVDRHSKFQGKLADHLSDLGQREFKGKMLGLNIVELEGNIGILCNGAGLTMATMDLVLHKGGKPSNFLDVGGGANKVHVKRALDLVSSDENVKVLLVNILGGITACDEVAAALAYYKELRPDAKLVVRLVGNNENLAKDIMDKANIPMSNILEEAVEEAVKLAAV